MRVRQSDRSSLYSPYAFLEETFKYEKASFHIQRHTFPFQLNPIGQSQGYPLYKNVLVNMIILSIWENTYRGSDTCGTSVQSGVDALGHPRHL